MTSSENKTAKSTRIENISIIEKLASIVKTTLGPFGADKLLLEAFGKSSITNDGATIVKSIPIEHPIAKIVVDIAKTQDQQIGDGTTSVILFCSELLSQTKHLLQQNIHPTKILLTYQKCGEIILKELQQHVQEFTFKDNEIIQLFETTTSGKSIQHYNTKIMPLLLEISKKKITSYQDIHITKTNGNIESSQLYEGLIVDKIIKEQDLKTTQNPRVALLNLPLEISEPETQAQLNIHSVSEYQELMEKEKQELIILVQKLKETQATLILNQKGIDPSVEYYLKEKGITVLQRCRKSTLEKLSTHLTIPIITTKEEIKKENTNTIDSIEPISFEEETFLLINKKKSKLITLVLKASSKQTADELERGIEDFLKEIISLQQDNTIVAGGGATELHLFLTLLKQKKLFAHDELPIVKAFLKSLLIIPKTLLQNSGHKKPKQAIQKLIKFHKEKQHHAGIYRDRITKNTLKKGLIEPKKIKEKTIKNALEATTTILRIDEILATKEFKNNGM
jgi:chaperonin GroEL (HSP60 family)